MKNDTGLNLFRFVKPVIHFFIITAVINFIFVGLDNIQPQITKYIVDQVIVGRDFTYLGILLGALLAIGVIRSIIGYTREFSCDWAGSKIGCEIRKDFFAKIQGLSADFFDSINSGQLMSRVMDDVNAIWELFTFVGMLLMEVAIHITVVIVMMFLLDWRLAIIPTVGMIFCGFISLYMTKFVGPLYGEIAEENSRLNNTAQENLSGIRTVKSFMREQFEIKKFRVHNDNYFELNFKQSKYFARFVPYFQIVRYLVPVIVLIQGGMYTMNGSLTLGELTAFMAYSMNIVWPMEMLGWLTAMTVRAKESYRRIDDIYKKKSLIECPADALKPPLHGEIEFKKVCFNSDDGKPILKNVSFKIGAGKTLGIMGATGSGKTTVINLLKRMYNIDSGSIKIDGIDIRDIDLEYLRKNISVVMQDVFLFSESVEDNLALGKKNCLDCSQIDSALVQSQSDDFVRRLEQGKKTIIGERGVGLSGGQKQRLTIARALSGNNAPVLVFDDSTSALDTETEKKIQSMLAQKQGMTKIVIAHRISAVKNADCILVMDKGRVAEHGSHEELLAKKGLYYQTWQVQYDL
ncbi:MAG: ABC transporter ATP-binding protein/permease [Treponema sp.]|nr:ABC transporter ATP-binding protein/permease [Treponema sp.]